MGSGYHGGFGSTKGAKSANNEKQDLREDYLRNKLCKSSPIYIPKSAKITDQNKTDYDQVKYTWTRGNFKYIARWHTRTPNAPTNQKTTWVVERVLLGIGNGKNVRKRQEYILIGRNKWVTKKCWFDAINARKKGNATKEQEELLNNGHWKA